MKFWLLTIITVAGCTAALAQVIRHKVIPGFLENANEEMVADWHSGLMDRFKETGTWPDMTDHNLFSEQMFLVVGPDGRRITGGYMHGRESDYRRETGNLYDIYGHAMKLTFSGDSCQVLSAGPDGVWGTADDVSSDKVHERYLKENLAQARAAVEARMARKK